MTEELREKITPLMIKGFQDAAEEGGQAVVKPGIVVGGVATLVCQPNECIMPDSCWGCAAVNKPLEPKLLAVPTNGWITLKDGVRER